jgi:poly-beta-1,6-N-acetyl-D-glucosamine N-deacetylase
MSRVLRYISAWLVANMLIWLGFVRKAKAATFRGEHILSVYFHKPSLKEFESCVKWLKKNHFSFLSTDELCRIIDQNLPLPKGAVVLTVDDGWQSNKSNIVDIAEKHQIPVTIFVATEPVEHGVYWWSIIEEAQRKGMTPLQVEQLKKVPNEKRLALVGNLRPKLTLKREALTVKQVQQIAALQWITVGAHTSTHPILNNCSEEQVYFEAQESKAKLQNWTGQCIDYFAYPNGNYSEREARIVSETGFKLAFSVRTEYLTKENLHRKYEIPRFEVIENASFAETICRMTGVWEPFIFRARNLFKKKTRPKKYSTPANSNSQKFATV